MLSGAQKQNVNALIATKLRGYYDSIIEEGTPPHLLDLLEQLHNAETEAKSKK
ncbi:NepR family anti-sigma factor [Rhizobium sp. AQ_MP]|uniref:NepR family anti-sigma factor n=1 Tax=Rhizobium sp. AQ_MP TaxID=2761536 RepID=UPI001FEDA465|nr:NepR family anti-sigma factor [Rhizobium sp. AQ_MP]